MSARPVGQDPVVAHTAMDALVDNYQTVRYRIAWYAIGILAMSSATLGYMVAANVESMSKLMHKAGWAAVFGVGTGVILVGVRRATREKNGLVLPDGIEQSSHMYDATKSLLLDAVEDLVDFNVISREEAFENAESCAKIARLAAFNMIAAAEDLGADCNGVERLQLAPSITIHDAQFGQPFVRDALSESEEGVYPVRARRAFDRLSQPEKDAFLRRLMAGQPTRVDPLYDDVDAIADVLLTRYMPALAVGVYPKQIYAYLLSIYQTVATDLVCAMAITEADFMGATFQTALHRMATLEMLRTARRHGQVDSETLVLNEDIKLLFPKDRFVANDLTSAHTLEEDLVYRQPLDACIAIEQLQGGQVVNLKHVFLRDLARAKGVVLPAFEPIEPALEQNMNAVARLIGRCYFPSIAGTLQSSLQFASKAPLAEPPVVRPSLALVPSVPDLSLLADKYARLTKFQGPRVAWVPKKQWSHEEFAREALPIPGAEPENVLFRLLKANYIEWNNFTDRGYCFFGAMAQAIFGGWHKQVMPRPVIDYSSKAEYAMELRRVAEVHHSIQPKKSAAARVKDPGDVYIYALALSDLFQVPIMIFQNGNPERDPTTGTLKPTLKIGEQYDAEPITLSLHSNHFHVLSPKASS